MNLKRLSKTTLLIIPIVLIGCNAIVLKKLNGITKMKIENEKTIKNYLIKRKIDTANVYHIKDYNSFLMASQKRFLTIPNAFFYDSNGNMIDYKKKPEDCNAKISGFIEDLKNLKSNNTPIIQSNRTEKDLQKVITNYNPNHKKERKNITVYITWAKWAGSLNKEKAFVWMNLLKEAQKNGIEVEYYLLNCDLQKDWNLSENEKKTLGI